MLPLFSERDRHAPLVRELDGIGQKIIPDEFKASHVRDDGHFLKVAVQRKLLLFDGILKLQNALRKLFVQGDAMMLSAQFAVLKPIETQDVMPRARQAAQPSYEGQADIPCASRRRDRPFQAPGA